MKKGNRYIVPKRELFTIRGFQKFVQERNWIRDLKNSGSDPPWTRDPFLREKRFCNIDRRDDRGTLEFLKVIREKGEDAQIIFPIVYRTAVSGYYLIQYLEKFKDPDELWQDIECGGWPQKINNKQLPYQFAAHEKGMSTGRYVYYFILPVWKSIVNDVQGWKGKSLKDGTNRILDIIAKEKRLYFGTYQAVADLSILFPGRVDPDSEPIWARASHYVLKEMEKADGIGRKDIVKYLEEAGFNRQQLEHGLCEFNKYCFYRIGQNSKKPAGQ